MSSETDELRRLLDERGVEWWEDAFACKHRTVFDGKNDVRYCVYQLGSSLFISSILPVTPEQAIAATLGRDNAGRYVGLCQGKYWERTENSNYYCGGCGWKVTDHDSYCPECGGALHKAALGSFNCSNSERTTTVDETETWQGVCTSKPIRYVRNLTIHVMECSECGRTYEHVNGGYEFCPRCGRKVVDE